MVLYKRRIPYLNQDKLVLQGERYCKGQNIHDVSGCLLSVLVSGYSLSVLPVEDVLQGAAQPGLHLPPLRQGGKDWREREREREIYNYFTEIIRELIESSLINIHISIFQFVEAAKSGEDIRLSRLRDVVFQLPPPNYR